MLQKKIMLEEHLRQKCCTVNCKSCSWHWCVMFLNFCLTFPLTNFRDSYVWSYNMLHYGLVIMCLFKTQY